MRVEDGFHLTSPPESHPYTDDPVLPNLLTRLFPESIRSEINVDLVRFGNDIRGYIRALTPLIHPPRIIQYDQWGRRIDRLETSEGWRKLKDIATREGLVAIPHERKHGEYSRIYGFAKTVIFAPDSHVIMCPISMTDGAARVIELFGTREMKDEIRTRLISRDDAFTSGQWMTERPGGSDISQTETTATPLTENSDFSPPTTGTRYSLNGFKWFSSATDSQIAVALARTGSPSLGSRSLSLFLVPLRLPLHSPNSSPISNGIYVHRLKNKYGTHALPTAELSLENTQAYLLGPLNQGVRAVATVLNITRIHSAVGSVGGLSRAYAIARSYATIRRITVHEGTGDNRVQRLLKDTPLHMSVLAKIGTTYHALTHLTFGTVALLGKSEYGSADRDEETRLRLLTPAVKAFASDKAVTAMEECMSSLGGQGYMEENDIGRLIRDSTVEKIWEGTVSVLSLDLIRASQGEQGITPFLEWANLIIASAPTLLKDEFQLNNCLQTLRLSLETLESTFSTSTASPFVPRPLLFLFAYTAAALYVLEHAVWASDNRQSYPDWRTDTDVFKRWVDEGLQATREEVLRAKEFGNNREKEDLRLIYGSRVSTTTAKL